MSRSVKEKPLIDLQQDDEKPVISQRGITIQSSQQSQNITKLCPPTQQQIIRTSFYNTMPYSMPINVPLSQPVGLSQSNAFTTQRFNSTVSNHSNQKQQRLPRTRRRNIPQVTVINTKTRQTIQTFGDRPGDYGNQHPQDKEIITRINRVLIQDQWSYSSLFGEDNRRLGDYLGEKSPRDKEFPAVLGLVSKQMRQNFKTYGADIVTLVECPQHRLKLVHQTMAFGLTPTNSRYFVFGLFTLSNNLDVILLALGFAKDQVIEHQKDHAYYYLLKTFIEANNEELTEERNRWIAKKKLLGRRIKEPEIVSDKNYIVPELLFCKTDKDMEQATDKIKSEFGVKFQVMHSYSQRFQVVRGRFQRHQIKKDKKIMADGEKIIRDMLQSYCPSDVTKGIAKLKVYNHDFESRWKRFGLQKHCFCQFQKRFVGFQVFQKYQTPMVNYLVDLVLRKNGNLFKNFLANISAKQQEQKEAPIPPIEDRFGLLPFRKRIRNLVSIVYPRVITEFLQKFQEALSLRPNKQKNCYLDTYLVGLGKVRRQVKVEFKHELWKCECGFFAKVGIPCPHLMAVLQTQKIAFERYINPRYYKTKQIGQIQLD